MNGPMVPFRQLVLKVHSRCDLACDHCYVYEHQDQSWRNRPKVMSQETVAWTAARLAEHAKTHGLDEIRVVLHGGEPLLAGLDGLRQMARTLRDALSGVCGLDLRIHTNGMLLDEAYCQMFADEGVLVGVSVDGYAEAHDRHRRYADGRGTYQQVVRAVGLLRTEPFRQLYAGLLCTIDLANDPVAVYEEALLALEPPRLEFLLPHPTWDNPPFRPPGADAAYADWLLTVFRRWRADGRPVPVRLFDSVISTMLGGASLTEAAGLEPSDLVVETDGTYEQADSLKTAYDGAPVTGMDVVHHDLDTVARHLGIAARQRGLAGLCATCRACPVVTSCGGGLYAHRYRAGAGFANPSVFCADLLKLITGIRQATSPATAIDRPEPVNVSAVNMSTRRRHEIPGAELSELAAGFGGADALGHLHRAQRSVRRALVAAVHDAAAGLAPGAGAARVREGWDLLARIDASYPQAVDAALAYPFLRVWAVHCLEGLRDGREPDVRQTGPLTSDLSYLAGIAMAAAIRGGLPARLAVPVWDGFAYLPSLGRFAAPGSGPGDTVMVESHQAPDGTFTIAAADGTWTVTPATDASDRAGPADGGPRWQPVRQLSAPGLSVPLEDADPFRDCYQRPAMPRLGEDMVALWESQFAMAWDLIQRQHHAYAPGLAASLTAIMPLTAGETGREVSATARHAFGAVAAALPAEHAHLALLLIHEFQHVKLGAIMDMFDLFDPADQRLYRVAWRKDPRPLEGVLQGTYAHVVVTDFWRVHRHTAEGPAARAVHAQFARWRAAIAEAIETLAGCGWLTPLGQTFVEGMRGSITPWLSEPVPADAGGRR
jgi:uncharacterized protein